MTCVNCMSAVLQGNAATGLKKRRAKANAAKKKPVKKHLNIIGTLNATTRRNTHSRHYENARATRKVIAI